MGTRIAVIGGGASGMMAAIAASRRGASPTIFEKNARIGKKLLATGNGRCNLTNTGTDSSHYHGGIPGFADGALSQFTAEKTLAFFEDLGIACRVEEEGKVFPRSGQAGSVLDVLRWELEDRKIEILCDTMVTSLEKKNHGFTLACPQGNLPPFDCVILAAGGKASPALSSNGGGYQLAQQMGHRMVEPWPALVPLKLDAAFLKQVKGIKWAGRAAVTVDGHPADHAEGELLFTEYGISGPPVMSLSRAAGEGLRRGKHVHITVTVIPDMTAAELQGFLERRFRKTGGRSAHFSLVGFINKQLIPVILREAGIADITRPASSLTASEVQALSRIMHEWRLPVTGTTSWPHAQVTAGGISTAEINRNTMESTIVPGLYFAGEMVDIDGDCGGFNLQWAWSSGHTAGIHAAAG